MDTTLTQVILLGVYKNSLGTRCPIIAISSIRVFDLRSVDIKFVINQNEYKFYLISILEKSVL